MSGKNTKSIIQFVVLLGIGILLIWLSLKGISDQQRKEIVVAFQTADYLWIIIAMVISLLSHFLRAYRWNYLLQPVGHKTNLLNATCYVLVGYFANYGIPRMGEVSRCTLASKYDKVPFEVAFGTVITERIIDFILFLVIFVLTLALQFTELIGLANKYVFDPALGKLSALSSSPVKLIVFGIIVFAFFGFLFLFRKKIANLLKGKLGGILKGMAEGIGSVRKMENPVKFITLSLMIWACYFYALYFCFFALPGTSHLGHKECLTLLLFGTFGVIFSPGGLGAYPAIVGGILLVTYKIDPVSAFALPWLSWTSQFILVVVLGIISLIVLPIYNRNRNVVSSTT
jgi:glycosyltransferase 2 family protein